MINERRKKIKKNISYLLLIITLSFIFTPNVNALKFYNAYNGKKYYSADAGVALTLKMAKDDYGNERFAYCMHESLEFVTSALDFDLDQTKFTTWQCKLNYKDENGVDKNVISNDCERIIGYILREVNRKYPVSKNSKENHHKGQQTLWNYLAKYDVTGIYSQHYSWGYRNPDRGKHVQPMIDAGMQAYYNEYVLGKKQENNQNLKEVDFTLKI